eukprot:TRINITY_DN10065_c0_g1_i2.p1 TRINITY_DN10065_c0_g1~~TRINITY_DN10065_c0_g1_i2.p1  ORF type:complete len:300 (+),score=47.19 TRINITY_DN10065_c0_g1_i2:53-901(+)
MEAHLCDCTGERHAIDIGADDTPAVVQAIAHQAFRYGAEVVPGELQLSVGGQVLCGEEPLSRAACVEGGCTIDVERVEPLQSYVDKLRGGETSLDQVPLWVRSERDAVVAAVAKSPHALQFADREVALAAIRVNPHALQYADESLKADRETVLAAVRNDPFVLKHAHESLKADSDLVMAAVLLASSALRYAHEYLKADRDFILSVVRRNPYALQYAHESLKADRDIVLTTVQIDPSTLEYAHDSLKADRELVLMAYPWRWNVLWRLRRPWTWRMNGPLALRH